MRRKKNKTLALLVITAACAAQSNAPADIIFSGLDGSITVGSTVNAADTIQANGGSNPTILVQSGANLTGDPNETAIAEILGSNYSFTNRGTLEGTTPQVISSTQSFVLNNYGTVNATFGGGQDGISTVGGSTRINNFGDGVISGRNAGIRFTTNGGSIVNNGAESQISAFANSASAIQGMDSLTVKNNGSIRGSNAISAGDGLTVYNDPSINFFAISSSLGRRGLIQGSDLGIAAGDNLTVINNPFGRIEGISDSAILAGDNARITNKRGSSVSTFRIASAIDVQNNATVFNGKEVSVLGATAGIKAADDLSLVNLGDIRARFFTGVQAGSRSEIVNFDRIFGPNTAIEVGDTARISNRLEASIIGGIGVSAGSGLKLTNNGTIKSTGREVVSPFSISITPVGISATGGGNTTITNNGTVRASRTAPAIAISRSAAGDVINNTGNILSGAIGVTFISGNGAVLNNSGTIRGNTASFLGAEGNDTVNLNLGSRIIGNIDGFQSNGSDVINFRGGLTSFDEVADGTSSNSILGDVARIDTINKSGGGVAFIGVPGNGGLNIETDTINISNGGLYINGNITGYNNAKTTINSAGAALGGTHIWNADVNVTAGGISAGAIPINLHRNPERAIGRVTITGDVDHSPGSFIRFDVAPGAILNNGVNSDIIRQTGTSNTYNVRGTNIRISPTDNNTFVKDGVYTVVDSDRPITGTLGNVTVQFNPNVNQADTGFIGSEVDPSTTSAAENTNTVLANNFTVASRSTDGTEVILTVKHDFSSLATTPAAAALGKALDATIGSANASEQDFIAALDYSSLIAVQSTLNAISPTDSFSTATTLASGNNRTNRQIQDHLAQTRANDKTIRIPVGSSSKDAFDSPAAASNRFNTWGNFSYSHREIDSNLGNDLDGEEASFTAGIDYRVAPNLLFGILLDGSSADYDFNGGSSDSDSSRAIIYGTYGESTGIYADFLFGYGSNDTDVSRNAGILGNINSSPEANSFQAMLTVGYTMLDGKLKHGPFGGLEYQHIDVDGYTQNGLFPIGVNGYDIDSVRILTGYRAEMQIEKVTPYASLAYAHEFQDGAINTTATLPGGNGFGVTGSGLESAIVISIGTNYAINQDLTLNTGYHGEISVGGDGTDSHGANIGLNYAF